MSPERDADREAILARRALFLASALGGLSLGAGDPEAPASPSAGPSPPTGPAPATSSAPARHEQRGPVICLSDDPLPEERRHVPTRTTSGLAQVCLSVMIDHAYRRMRSEAPMYGLHGRLPLAALVPVVRDGQSTTSPLLGGGLDAVLGVGLTSRLDGRLHLGLSFATGAGSVLQPGGSATFCWNITSTLWTGLGAGGGYLWTVGKDSHLRLENGSFAQIDLIPIGLRTDPGGQLELGPRVGLSWAHQRDPGGGDRFGFVGVTMGLDVTYLIGSGLD